MISLALSVSLNVATVLLSTRAMKYLFARLMDWVVGAGGGGNGVGAGVGGQVSPHPQFASPVQTSVPVLKLALLCHLQ